MFRKYFFVCILLLFLLTPFLVSLPEVRADSHVVINEILVHPSSGNKEWVEFYNPDNSDLSNYWIDDDTSFTDDSGNSSKKSLASLSSGKDTNHPYIETSSMFNNDGDSVVLFDNTGTIVDQYHYTDDPGSDVTIGRSPDGTGPFQILASATQGDFNTLPQPTDTPTSPPQPTATDTPKPTHTPTPTKMPTPTKVPTKAISSTSETGLSTKPGTLFADSTDNPSIDLSNMPTAILGSSISAILTVPPVKKPGKEEVLVKGSSNDSHQLTAIIFIASAGLLFVCGILVYWKIRKKNQES